MSVRRELNESLWARLLFVLAASSAPAVRNLVPAPRRGAAVRRILVLGLSCWPVSG